MRSHRHFSTQTLTHTCPFVADCISQPAFTSLGGLQKTATSRRRFRQPASTVHSDIRNQGCKTGIWPEEPRKSRAKKPQRLPRGQESRITGTQTLAKAESSVGGGGPRQGETRLRDCVRKSFSFLMPQDSAGANDTRPSSVALEVRHAPSNTVSSCLCVCESLASPVSRPATRYAAGPILVCGPHRINRIIVIFGCSLGARVAFVGQWVRLEKPVRAPAPLLKSQRWRTKHSPEILRDAHPGSTVLVALCLRSPCFVDDM
ncbi:hypothetical protein BKA56DRAFT_31508 [Ilyonectria sp. MPI-CAGE-AT-0026]|nr:hypothetical protein BKA56DRAFT_31508 [Ilyonectria sp. MPI-CAGE-AT-0026]